MLAPVSDPDLCRRAMPSLCDIQSAQRTLLLIDACSELVQTSVIRSGVDAKWECAKEEAGTGVFACIERFGDQLASVDAYVFCEGPGSILGIRTVAAAIRTWILLQPKPVWSYKSLELLAHSVPEEDITIISDARRDSWHVVRRGERMRRVPTAEVSREGPLAMPGNFRQWGKLPDSLSPRLLDYDLATLLPRVWHADIFQPCEAPDAFLHEEPSYATWSPQIHRATT